MSKSSLVILINVEFEFIVIQTNISFCTPLTNDVDISWHKTYVSGFLRVLWHTKSWLENIPNR